jgi:tetratricopeptide (TPR) repeat protein
MASTFSSVGTGIDRKSLKRPDGFVSTVGRFFSSMNNHTTGLIAALVGLIALGVVAGVWMNRIEAKTEAARNALYLAEKAMGTELKAVAEKVKVPSASPQKNQKKDQDSALALQSAQMESASIQKLDVDSTFPEAVKKFKAVENEYGGTRAAHEARLKLGNLYYNHGDYGKAVAWYEKAVSSAPGNFEKTLALSALGYTYENLGKPSEAVQTYQKALNLGEGGLKGDLLLGMARSYEALHDTAKARSTYDQILSELSGTDSAKSAEVYKSWLQ